MQKKHSRWLIVVVALSVLALVVSSCGGDDATPTPRPPTATPVPQAPTATPRPQAPTATPTPSGPQPKYGGILRTRTNRDPINWDLHRSRAETEKVQTMYNNLIITDPYDETRIVPDLAESFGPEGDGTSWTFKIHQGVTWHDGQPFSVSDVVYSLERLAFPRENFKSIFADLLADIESVTAVDSATVQIKLSQPSPVFQSALASGLAMIMPAHLDENIEAHPIGTGAFFLQKFQKGVGFEYRKNEEYFKEGLPYMDGIDMFLIPENATALAAFRTGDIDWTSAAGRLITSQNVDDIKREIPGLQLFEFTGAIFTLFLNDRAPFTNPDVRRALHIGVDREEMVLVGSQGEGTPFVVDMPSPGKWSVPASQLQGAPGWRTPKAGDIAEARSLMERAGFTSRNPLKFKILLSNQATLTDGGTIITAQWNKINASVELDALDRASVTQLRENGSFEVYAELLSHFLDEPAVVYPAYFLTGAVANWGKYSIPELDRLYAEQLVTIDEAKRVELVRQIQQVTLDKNWWMPAGESSVTHGMYPYVKQFPTVSFGFFSNRYRHEQVWLDR